MQYLKIILGNPFDRAPAQELVTNSGERYERAAAAKGKLRPVLCTTGEVLPYFKQIFLSQKQNWFTLPTGKKTAGKKL